MLEEAEARARDRGCHALTLESGYQRAEAHHMYRRFGMRDDGKSFLKTYVKR
jgi:GNAT superfamily N-acetyltransferase